MPTLLSTAYMSTNASGNQVCVPVWGHIRTGACATDHTACPLQRTSRRASQAEREGKKFQSLSRFLTGGSGAPAIFLCQVDDCCVCLQANT